eukprot:IDg1193t1
MRRERTSGVPVLCRSKYLYSGTDYDREITARARYVKAILQRSRRYGTFEFTVDPGFGDAAAAGFSVWFYRIRREGQYGVCFRAKLNSYPWFSKVISAEPHLLCLGSLFLRRFQASIYRLFGFGIKHIRLDSYWRRYRANA